MNILLNWVEIKKRFKPPVCLKEENRNSSIYHIYVLPFLILVHRIRNVTEKMIVVNER